MLDQIVFFQRHNKLFDWTEIFYLCERGIKIICSRRASPHNRPSSTPYEQPLKASVILLRKLQKYHALIFYKTWKTSFWDLFSPNPENQIFLQKIFKSILKSCISITLSRKSEKFPEQIFHRAWKTWFLVHKYPEWGFLKNSGSVT